MWELDCEESWAPKNWCFWSVVLEKTLESPLDCKEIQPVHSKGDQSWVFFGRNDAKAETLVLWPPHGKSWLIGKDSDAGCDWGQEEKGMTENEMAEWHHWLDGREFEWTPRDGDGQGVLACCDSWSHKESDMTEGLNWTELMRVDGAMYVLPIWDISCLGSVSSSRPYSLSQCPAFPVSFELRWDSLSLLKCQIWRVHYWGTSLQPSTNSPFWVRMKSFQVGLN